MESAEEASVTSQISELNLSSSPDEVIQFCVAVCEFVYKKNKLKDADKLQVWSEFIESHPDYDASAEEIKDLFFEELLPRIAEIYPNPLSYRRRYFAALPHNNQVPGITKWIKTANELDSIGDSFNETDEDSFLSGFNDVSVLEECPLPKINTGFHAVNMDVENEKDDGEFFKWFFESVTEMSKDEIKDHFKKLRLEKVSVQAKLNRKLEHTPEITPEEFAEPLPVAAGQAGETGYEAGWSTSTPISRRPFAPIGGSSSSGSFNQFQRQMLRRQLRKN